MENERAALVSDLKKLASLVPLDASAEFWGVFSDVVGRVLAAFCPPDVVRVGSDHLDVAVSIATAYLDGTESHDLLAAVLSSVEDDMAMNPEFRLGVLGALGQLVVDALTASVMASAQRGRMEDPSDDAENDDDIDEETVRRASGLVLQRIALARRT